MKLPYILENKILTWFFCPILLLLFWVFCSIYFSSTTSFSVLSAYHGRNTISNSDEGLLLKGDIIGGEFVARENNLGIISVRFNPPNAVEYEKEDEILFKVREKGENEWFVENLYKAGLIYDVPFFPFGFPKIENSKDRVYEFQIQSMSGNTRNAIALSSVKPSVMTHYSFESREVLSSFSNTLRFFANKVMFTFTNIDFLIYSIPYLIPLVFYSLLLLQWKRSVKYFHRFEEKLDIGRYLLFNIVICCVAIDIFLNDLITHTSVYIILLIFILYAKKLYRLHSSVLFLYAFIFFILSCAVYFTDEQFLVEKSSNWTFFLLILGGVSIIFDFKKKKRLVPYKQYILETFRFVRLQ